MQAQALFLSHAEFLASLDAVKTTVLVGVQAGKLFPQDEDERLLLLKQGKNLLKQRGLLVADGQFHRDLLRAARIMAYPQVALLIIRHVLALSPQLFALYQSQEGIIEHTCPKEGVHRLAIIPDIPTLLIRATQILSLPEQDSLKSSVEIEQEAFFKLHELTQHAQHGPALEILERAGMQSSAAEALVVAMEKPTFSGHAVLFKCDDQAIVDGRDIVVVQDQKTAWYAAQRTPGQPTLLVKSLQAREMFEIFSRCFSELAGWQSVAREA